MIEPLDLPGEVELGMAYDRNAFFSPIVEWRKDKDSDWQEFSEDNVTYREQDNEQVGVAKITKGGEYKVSESVNSGALAAIIICGLLFVSVVVGLCYHTYQYNDSKSDNSFKQQGLSIN